MFEFFFYRHGIGHFLGVHEGPQRIAFGYNEYEEGLADGMFLSDEPGFYKPGDFGIRIENDMEVVLANRSTYDNAQFLRFNTITFVPYERSLIDVTLLTKTQINAINQYHETVAQILEPLLAGDESALKALRSRTEYLNSESSMSSSSTGSTSVTTSTNQPGNKTFIIMSSPVLITFIFILIMLF